MTLYLQVLDAVVKKPYMDYLKYLYSEWLLTKNNVLTQSGAIKEPNGELLCHSIKIMAMDISKNDSQRL